MNLIDQIVGLWKEYKIVVGIAAFVWAVVNGRNMYISSGKESSEINFDGEDLGVKVYKRNVKWAKKWIGELCLVFAAFVCFGEFKMEHDFPASHIDGIIAISTVIGIVGALWALFARVDAEKAFHKAQETFDKSQETFKKSQETLHKAQETLDALGNSFNFSEIFYNDRIPSILNAIAEEHTTVSMFLGFPCIACLYAYRDEIPGGDAKVREMFSLLIAKLNKIGKDIMRDDKVPYTFNLATFSFEEIENIIEVSPFSFEDASHDLMTDYKQELRFIIREKQKKPQWNEKIKVHIIDKQKEKFRFASVRGTRESSTSKAIIWVVPDFPTEKNGFKSACFQTKADNLVIMLGKVFDKATDDSNELLAELEKNSI